MNDSVWAPRVAQTTCHCCGDCVAQGPTETLAVGEIFDRVYDRPSVTSAPLTDLQTTGSIRRRHGR